MHSSECWVRSAGSSLDSSDSLTFSTCSLSLSLLGGLDELTKGTSSESPECPTMSSCTIKVKHTQSTYLYICSNVTVINHSIEVRLTLRLGLLGTISPVGQQTLKFLWLSKASMTISAASNVLSSRPSWPLKRYILPLTSTTSLMRFGYTWSEPNCWVDVQMFNNVVQVANRGSTWSFGQQCMQSHLRCPFSPPLVDCPFSCQPFYELCGNKQVLSTLMSAKSDIKLHISYTLWMSLLGSVHNTFPSSRSPEVWCLNHCLSVLVDYTESIENKFNIPILG